ncbi:MAG TPA: heme biosynthesis protein, partial [Planctomycetes bacterium]|nr:heme biosynthesis protein [Planctomycetota bacterium]
MSSVSVSIDGLEASHDQLRNLQGSWRAATQAVENAREAGLLVSVNTQVNRVNRGELDALLELLDEWGCFAWQVQFTVPMGRAADNWEWLLQPVDFLEAVPMVAALKLAAKERGIEVYPGNNVGYFGPHEHTLRGDHYRRGHTLGCTAGHSTLGLEADGKVKGCPSLPSGPYTGGNVRERPLREIWEDTAELRFTRDQTIELWGFCAGCYYAEECRAGCTWTSHVIMGRPGNNPYCHHRALERQREGLAERMVPAEPAPGEPFDHGRFELVL